MTEREALRKLLDASVAMVHHDPHDLGDSRPCETCRTLRIAQVAAAVALGDATCWCVKKTYPDRRDEWRDAAHFIGCPNGGG